MDTGKLIITPDTKLYDILDSYPESRQLLSDLSPAFSKLTSPELIKTIAKVTTLRQIASAGNVSIHAVMNTLHRELNISFDNSDNSDEPSAPDSQWIHSGEITVTLDARPMLAAGEHPVGKLLMEIETLKNGEIYNLITSFIPEPLLEKAKEKGYHTFTRKISPSEFHNLISPI